MSVSHTTYEVAYLRDAIVARSSTFDAEGCGECGNSEFTVNNDLVGGHDANVKVYTEVICDSCGRSELIEFPLRLSS